MQFSGIMAEASRRSLLTNLGQVLEQSMRGGSPLGEHRNLNSVGGSPAYEQEPAGRNIKKAQEFPPGMIVTMFDNVGEHVAKSMVSTIGVGEWLKEERLQPTDIAILITKVFKPATFVQEVLKDIMGECLHSTIRWPRRHVRGTERIVNENVEEAVESLTIRKTHRASTSDTKFYRARP